MSAVYFIYVLKSNICQHELLLIRYWHKVDLISYVKPRLKMICSLCVWELRLSNYCNKSLELCIFRTFCLLKYIRFIFLPFFLGEFYWKSYLPIWPLLFPWYCISSPLPPRHSFCVPGIEERKWMSALPSGSVLWQARNSSALRRSPLSPRVNTFPCVPLQWEDFIFLLYWFVWAKGEKSKYFLCF